MDKIYNLIAKEISGEISEVEQKEMNQILNESVELSTLAEIFRKDWCAPESSEISNEKIINMLKRHHHRMKNMNFDIDNVS